MKPQTDPPDDYEALIRLIHDQFEGMSRTSKKIAVYLTQNPNDVAMLSVNAIANRCGIHASSFVRFAQSLGYKGFRDLQGLFYQRLSDAAPGFEARLKALDAEPETGKEKSEQALLRALAIRDIAALQDLAETVDEADLQRAVRMLERADTIYLVGQLRSEPVVVLLSYALTMLGKRTRLLDGNGGLATHAARAIGARDVLVAVSFRFYTKEPVAIAAEARDRGVPVIAISDTTLSPIAKSASVLFTVPEHEHAFSRSLAAPICLAQALAVSLAARLQSDRVSPRIPTASQE